MNSFSSETSTSRRPDVFRALGADEPPLTIAVAGSNFRLVRCLKHDSWAATVLYADKNGRRLACKINRRHPLPGCLPADRLGRWLARREERVMRELRGIDGFPRWAGEVAVDGAILPTAVAHWWVDGEPFRPDAKVGDDFFPSLCRMLSAFHATGCAYVDMSKWGNIIVGSDGRPCLLDYQIYFRAGGGYFSRCLLRQLQKGDWFYLRRHWRRCRPDQFHQCAERSWSTEPPHIWFAERVGFLFRGLRIGILRISGVKGDPRRNDENACKGAIHP